jgi:acetyl-CoA synthetase
MGEAIYPVPADWAEKALVDDARYTAMYQQSVSDPDAFWAQEAKRIDWIKPFTKVKNTSYHAEDFGIRWFEDGTLNLSANALDRHLATRGDQIAILWEPDSPDEAERRITYRELHEMVCRFANVLKDQGVNRGDRVTIYLPMVPEAAVAMLACARIGAIHSIVFAGFSPKRWRPRRGLRQPHRHHRRRRSARRQEGSAEERRCSNGPCAGHRKGHRAETHRGDVPMVPGRDIDWHTACAAASPDNTPEEMNAEDPLFILYTSGSTGKPKGVLHTTGGYSVWVSATHQYVFDYRPGQIYWCAADVGWVTGHSYLIYGPLINGGTTLMFEGVPNYPDPSRFWQVVDKYQVEIFTAPPPPCAR